MCTHVLLVAKALCMLVAVDYGVADRCQSEPCGGSNNCKRKDCKQLQNKTGKLRPKPSHSLHVHVARQMALTLFNAHGRSLSSLAVTAMHGLHLQDYTAANLSAIECTRSAHLRFEAIMSIYMQQSKSPAHAVVKV